jgi:hypothetical protein
LRHSLCNAANSLIHVSHVKGEIVMKMILCGAALSIALLLALEPALAQFAPLPSTSAPPEDTPSLVGKLKKRPAPPATDITGTWIGQLTQVGSDAPHQFEIAISASGAETRYPDLDCVGKLTRIGSSKSYVFFVEIITKGQAEKGGRCPDGTITVARQGYRLALRWFGSIQDDVVVAYGILSRKVGGVAPRHITRPL